jgi:putative polyketide hydroxylase
MERVSVLVIGGSSVGLATAALLAHHGVKPLVVERRAGLSIHPRALGVGIRTLEVLRELGLVDELRATVVTNPVGGKISVDTLASAEPRPTAARSIPKDVATSVSPVTHVSSSQDRIDAVLHAATVRKGGEVRFGTTFESLTHNKSGATVTVRGESGSYQVHADYVVAADGGRSAVRDALGIGITGPGPIGDENLSVLFSADLSDLVQFVLCEVRTPDAPGMMISMGGGRYVFHTGVAVAQGREPIDLVRTAIGVPDLPVEVLSVMSWQVNGTLADTFRSGQVFLAGDSAHTVPPMGATGMNSGIADAYNLAWKLAAVIQGRAGAALLDSYEEERRPMAEINLAQALLRADHPQLHWDSTPEGARRRAEVGLRAAVVNNLGDRYASKVIVDPEPELPSTQDVVAILDGAPGSRVPHEWLNTGRTSTVDLAGPDFALLTGMRAQAWREAASSVSLRPHVVASGWLEPDGAMLVRPDGFIAWRGSAPSGDPVSELRSVLDRVLCLATPGTPS